MIASLPMYERPENAAAHDRFWQAIRGNLDGSATAAPAALTRGADPWEIWRAPDLLLSQTCGLPYRTRLHGRVTLIGTPDFGIADRPGHYTSVLVVRRSEPRTALADFAGARIAVNEALSQSGWAAPQAHMAALGLPAFDDVVVTGSHRSSAGAVAAGVAELAAIDAITWRLIARWDTLARDLRVIDETRSTPGLPYIAALGTDPDGLFAAIERAIPDLSAEDREGLGGLRGLARIAPEAYLALPPAPPLPPERAIAG